MPSISKARYLEAELEMVIIPVLDSNFEDINKNLKIIKSKILKLYDEQQHVRTQ